MGHRCREMKIGRAVVGAMSCSVPYRPDQEGGVTGQVALDEATGDRCPVPATSSARIGAYPAPWGVALLEAEFLTWAHTLYEDSDARVDFWFSHACRQVDASKTAARGSSWRRACLWSPCTHGRRPDTPKHAGPNLFPSRKCLLAEEGTSGAASLHRAEGHSAVLAVLLASWSCPQPSLTLAPCDPACQDEHAPFNKKSALAVRADADGCRFPPGRRDAGGQNGRRVRRDGGRAQGQRASMRSVACGTVTTPPCPATR